MIEMHETHDAPEAPLKYDGSDIQILEGLEAVRLRPAMYIGSTGTKGLHHLVFEVVDNSIDEVLAGACQNINVILHQDGSCSVSDDGRGIPVDEVPGTGKKGVEVVMTILHAGGKFDGSGYKETGGLHGVGVSVVNGLSAFLEVEVKKEGKVYRQTFTKGDKNDELTVVREEEGSGTLVRFKPDPEIFKETTEFSFDILAQRLRELAFLNKGIKIFIKDEKTNKEHLFKYDGGIQAFVEYLNANKEVLHEPPIYFRSKKDDTTVEIALQYNAGYIENIFSFVNNINTIEGGYHLTGFKNALTRCVNNYARQKKLLKENDVNFSGEDVREGMTSVVSVKLPNPQFEGQTKTKLGNTEVRIIVENVLDEGLGIFLEENPKIGKNIIEKSLNAMHARDAAKKAREIVRRKSALEGSSLPGKLADCSSRNPHECEIYLVEGDSAGGSAKQGRDRHFQAILPLRGKILNVEKARLHKILGYDQIKIVIIALGTGIGEDFDISKLRYNKVIIMTDADVDGAHIRTLLLTFFFRFMPELIEKGHIYIAQPPLFKIKKGKSEHYLQSEEELEKMVKKYEGNCIIQRFKGLGEMDALQLWETTMNPATRTLKKVNLEDAVEADVIFTILMGDKVEPRRLFIQKYAKEVKNLDL